MKTYHLKPCTTPANLASDPLARKPHPNTPDARAAAGLTDAIAPAPRTPPPLPAPRVPAPRPAVQPLPAPVVDPAKPTLKLGLDVHLEFLMAVAQRDHAAMQSRGADGKRLETPHLAVKYSAPQESLFWKE